MPLTYKQLFPWAETSPPIYEVRFEKSPVSEDASKGETFGDPITWMRRFFRTEEDAMSFVDSRYPEDIYRKLEDEFFPVGGFGKQKIMITPSFFDKKDSKDADEDDVCEVFNTVNSKRKVKLREISERAKIFSSKTPGLQDDGHTDYILRCVVWQYLNAEDWIEGPSTDEHGDYFYLEEEDSMSQGGSAMIYGNGGERARVKRRFYTAPEK